MDKEEEDNVGDLMGTYFSFSCTVILLGMVWVRKGESIYELIIVHGTHHFFE